MGGWYYFYPSLQLRKLRRKALKIPQGHLSYCWSCDSNTDTLGSEVPTLSPSTIDSFPVQITTCEANHLLLII